MPAEPCPPAQESRLLEATPLIRSILSEAGVRPFLGHDIHGACLAAQMVRLG